MIAFIDDHRATDGVEPICRVLPIAPSTDHAHAARRTDPERLPARAKRDAVLMAEIRRVDAAHFRVDSVRKVWRQLARDGIVVARCTVARLTRTLGSAGVVRGRRIRTTIPDPAARLTQTGQPPGNPVWFNGRRTAGTERHRDVGRAGRARG
ncbi:hypothetical protein JOE48_003639 [Methylobacterium sp. PvR107]|nr:hypothetical protein [Methylobacterium sp. PvR107]